MKVRYCFGVFVGLVFGGWVFCFFHDIVWFFILVWLKIGQINLVFEAYFWERPLFLIVFLLSGWVFERSIVSRLKLFEVVFS